MDIKKISPHLAYVATLPCETLMSAKQALNDKLQGSLAAYLSVAAYLRFGRIFKYPFNCKFTRDLAEKNFLNRLRFDRIMVMSLRPAFLTYRVYLLRL